jgi:hypothetical protein
VSFKRYKEICEAHETPLDQRFVNEVERGKSLSYQHTPTPLLRATAYAGRLLREEPQTQLGTSLIDEAPFRDNPTATILTRIINTSVARVDPDDELPNFENDGTTPSISGCGYAEEAFANTLVSLRRRLPLPTKGAQVFTEDGQPVLLRKRDNIPSALTLTDIIIDGVWYPRGSVTRVETARDYNRRGKYGPRIPRMGIEELPTEDIERIAFVRLSALALPRVERYRDFHGTIQSTPQVERALLNQLPVDGPQDIVSHALRLPLQRIAGKGIKTRNY